MPQGPIDPARLQRPTPSAAAPIDPARLSRVQPATDGPPKPPGFFGGIRETVFPFESLTEAAREISAPFRHPVTVGLPVLGALLDAQGDQLVQGIDAARLAMDAASIGEFGPAAGAGAEATGRFAAGIVPLFGPEAARIGETAAGGEIARAAGQTTGMAGTFFLPAALRRLPTSRVGGPPLVPLLRGERARGGTLPRFLESLTERTIPGAGIFERFRQEQQAALLQLADETVSKISTFTGPSLILGRRLGIAIDESLLKLKADARVVYGQIDAHTQQRIVRRPTTVTEPSQIVGPGGEALTTSRRVLRKTAEGGVSVPTRTLKQVAIPLKRRILAEAQLINPEELSGIMKQLDQIIGSPRRVGFQAMQDSRSTLLAISRRYGDPIPGKAGGIAKKLSGELDEVMMKAARDSGIPGLEEMVRGANAQWKFITETFNDTLIKRLIDASPEQMPAFLRTATVDDINAVRSILPKHQFDDLRGRVMKDILDEATEGELVQRLSLSESLGLSVEGRPPLAPTTTFSGQKLSTMIQRVGPDRLNSLFGRGSARELAELADLAKVAGRRAGSMIPGLIAGGMNVTILLPILKPLGFSFGTLGSSAGLTVGFNVLARALVRQPGRAAYLDFLRAMGTGNTPLAIAAANRVTAIMGREIAADATELGSLEGRGPIQVPTGPPQLRATLAGPPPF